MAVVALATAEGDARARVCLAMSIIEPLNKNEFSQKPDLWLRLEKLRRETKMKGPQVICGRLIKNAYENTAVARQNKTYKKYAKEIMDIWIQTTD